jgi:hypothetical protein
MNGTSPRFVRLGLGFVGLVALGCVLTGQAAKPVRQGIALPTDWSHSHLVFSQPRSVEQAARLQEDPRFEQQLYRRYQSRVLTVGKQEGSVADGATGSAKKTRRTGNMNHDWSQDLGSGGSVGAGNYPAKFSFSSTIANCGTAAQPDFVVYSTGQAVSGTQATIVAYDNLYTGCGGTVPSVYWAYNTAGKILTSPVFSRDGSQVSFVQTSGGVGSLVLLKWKASASETVASPGVPTLVAPALYSACVTPCMTTFVLEDGSLLPTNDTTSSVFYDYVGETAWVGDSEGWLHQFTPVFLGTPAEVRTSPWPVQVNPSSPLPLTSAVHDHVSGNVFVGDGGGFLYRVSASTGAVTQSGQLDVGIGIVAGPLVDSTSGLVYVFASDDDSAACAGGADCAGVYQFAANFGSGSVGTEEPVGASTFSGVPKPNPLYNGGFDNTYISSANATGNLYVCGSTGAEPTLYQVPITGGVLGTPVALSTLSTAGTTPACSPVTDVSSPGATAGSAATERLFLSVGGSSNVATCSTTSGGCVQNFIDTPWQASTTFAVGQEILIKRSSPLTRYIQVVTAGGTSGAVQPNWPSNAGGVVTDGTVHWLTQGQPAFSLSGWAASHPYTLDARIIDSNGNVEVATTAGTSGSPTAPIWATTPGLTTADGTGTLVWTNAGAVFTNAFAAAGGSSGIILDNTVLSGTLVGASQVYFSTLSDQACDNGTGGCAVQASQPLLQ